jgi:intracellular septation protein A
MKMPLHVLLLQVLPILVFIVVDALVEDPAWAIGAALLFVAFQTVTTYARTKKLDPFIAVDALLIGGMGLVSILTQNEIFFLLKPAIIEGVMVPYLGFLAIAPERVLKGYFERYAYGQTLPVEAFRLLRKLVAFMAAFVLVHALAVVYAALYWSRAAWAWVSGPGFYVLLVPLGIWALVQRFRARGKPRTTGARIRKQTPPTSECPGAAKQG